MAMQRMVVMVAIVAVVASSALGFAIANLAGGGADDPTVESPMSATATPDGAADRDGAAAPTSAPLDRQLPTSTVPPSSRSLGAMVPREPTVAPSVSTEPPSVEPSGPTTDGTGIFD
jgi:hypothetical protein